MLARVWGCRGSLAAPGESTVRYGGNTSCVEVRLESGHVLVLDAGNCGLEPSTIVDLSGDAPRLLRSGKGDPRPFQ